MGRMKNVRASVLLIGVSNGETVNCEQYVACIYSSRTYHLAFAAKHTFFGIFADFGYLSAHNRQLKPTQIERNKITCRTGRRTGSAADTYRKRRLVPQHKLGCVFRRRVHIYLLTLGYAVSEIHFLFFFRFNLLFGSLGLFLYPGKIF